MLPIIYQGHDLVLYSYPLLMGIGWGVAYQLFFANLENDYPRLKAQILYWGIFLSAWIGAKILFILTVPSTKIDYLNSASFWIGGGFVFYGGFLGALLFLGIYKIFDHRFNLSVLWPMLPALAIGHAIGRIGCFLAGCCFGEPTNSFWGIYLHDHYRHPTQLIESCGLFLIGIYLLKSKASRVHLIGHYLLFYGALRLVVESLRGDIIRGSWGHFSPSQWISILLIISGITLISICKYRPLSHSK